MNVRSDLRALASLLFTGVLWTGCLASPVDTSGLSPQSQQQPSISPEGPPSGYDEPPRSFCEANVTRFGRRLVEIDYLPNVLQCEHGDDYVPLAALQAQAIAARTYLYVRTRGGSVPIGNSYTSQVAYCNKPTLSVSDRRLWLGDALPQPVPATIAQVRVEQIKPAYRRFFEAVQTTEAMILMGVSDSPSDVRVRKYYNGYYESAHDFTGGTAYTEYTRGDETCAPCSTQAQLDERRNWSQCLKAYAFPSGQVDRKRDGHMGQHNASCRARLLGEDYRALLAHYYSADARIARWAADCADSHVAAGYVDEPTSGAAGESSPAPPTPVPTRAPGELPSNRGKR
jgi:hypothetical protein